jgi:hypothetical protein
MYILHAHYADGRDMWPVESSVWFARGRVLGWHEEEPICSIEIKGYLSCAIALQLMSTTVGKPQMLEVLCSSDLVEPATQHLGPIRSPSLLHAPFLATVAA